MSGRPLKNGHDFLQRMLTQGAEAEDPATLLNELVLTSRLPEDTWLDYKDGRYFDDLEKAKKELRRDITAFANGDGGCLVIGVGETKEDGTALSLPNGFVPWTNNARTRQCIEGVLTSLVGQILPPPRAPIYIDVPGGVVVVIPVLRSGRFAAISENGTLAYYIRVIEGRAKVPDYLVSDLMFGRRQQPDLALHVQKALAEEVAGGIRITITLELENRGLTLASEVVAGALVISLPGPHLQEFARRHRIESMASWGPGRPGAVRAVQPLSFDWPLPPFRVRTDRLVLDIPSRPDDNELQIRFAVWVATDSSPPRWWQIECQTQGWGDLDIGQPQEVWEQLPMVSVTSF